MRKTTAGILGGAVVVAAILLGKYGFGGGGSGRGDGDTGRTEPVSAPLAAPADDAVQVVVDGDQYVVNGKPAELADVVGRAKAGGTVTIRKKGTARFNAAEKLTAELDRQGIRYSSQNEF
ncbi:MAG TPA: hypothetical protein VEA69_11095 [Tepidisphaeraceae bacterium]|nr:hypothetical protein [Tepidisphaeraceae bacterium]